MQQVGTTGSAMPVTVTNSGSTPLNFTGIQTLVSFSQTNDCGTQIAAGASCTIQVRFAPAKTGSNNSGLFLNDDGGGSPQGVALTGTGT